jgi:hypothetical protein
MSNSYYRLKHPISNVSLSEKGSHTEVRIWVNKGLAGTLVLESGEETKNFLQAIFSQHEEGAWTSYGGDKKGMMLYVGKGTNDTDVLISSSGEITTVKELAKKAGEVIRL